VSAAGAEGLAALIGPRLAALEAAAAREVYVVAPLASGGLLCDGSMASRNASALEAEDLPWLAAFLDAGGLEAARGPAIVDAARAAAALRASGGPGEEGAPAAAAAAASFGFMGTDGMRGTVDAPEAGDCVSDFFGSGRLRPELVEIAAKAYGRMMIEEGPARKGDLAVVAEDGRDLARRGELKAALIAGLGEAGLSVLDLGVIPTPFVPWAMLRRGLACGAMLTASHNPSDQNGVKFFREGKKLLPEGRLGDLALSGRMYREYLERRGGASATRPAAPRVERAAVEAEAAAFAVSALPEGAAARLRGLRLAADAAAGAAHSLLGRVFALLGVDGAIVSPVPDGSNINRGCGVAEIEGRDAYAAAEAAGAPALVRELFSRGRASGSAEWGLALDGDGDRGFVLAYDPARDEVLVANGDREGALLARRAVAAGAAAGDFVASVESDPMCARYAREILGLRAEIVSVGDKWLGAYSKGPLLAGVEPSGHVVLPAAVRGPDGAPRELRAGNGIVTCLAAIAAALELRLGPAEAARPYDPGFCETFYTYFVAKPRFFPGSAAWEASAEAIGAAFRASVGRGELPGDLRIAFEEKEDPGTLYAAFLLDGAQAAAAFCRNSGTEDKIAAYVQCPAAWAGAFAGIGAALAEVHGRLMRDRGRPECRAAEAIVDALRDIGSAGLGEDSLAALAPSGLRGALAGLVKEGRASVRDGRVYAGGRAFP
jgi:phosphomannomutase